MAELLEFEREMLLNVLHENSLTITSKGIANDRLLVNLVRTYSSACHLVLVIGAEVEEEDSVISKLDELRTAIKETDDGDDEEDDFLPPKRINAESFSAANRRDIYLSGGVIFITTRILVVDMLTKRLPFEAVSGIVVVNAHRVIKDCHLSFILRLFRLRNKTGFITALSQNASGFLGAFAQLERIMRNLFVSKLFLWPRFHAEISETFSARPKPKVIEMRIYMTREMKQIQFALIDLISMCIKELRTMNSFIYTSALELDSKDDENALNTINVVSRGLNKITRAHLDSVWFQLSPRARQTIRDMRLLKSLLFHLTQLDAVSFYAELKSIRDNVSPDKPPSDWLFWPPSETLFKVSQERLFFITESSARQYCIEINPKLEALYELLNEIKDDITKIEKKSKRLKVDDLNLPIESTNEDEDDNDVDKNAQSDSKLNKTMDIIIVVESRYSVFHIEKFRDKGKEVVLQELKAKCEILLESKLAAEAIRRMNSRKQGNKTDIAEESEGDAQTSKEFFEEQLTLTQMLGNFACEEEMISRKHDRFQFHYFEWDVDNNCALGLQRLLASLRPRYVILYEPEMCCIRQIELYQALHADQEPINVYYFIFDASAEEQRYLRNLQVEKAAFERLIEEKSKLAKVSDADGVAGHHPDLARGVPRLLHADIDAPSNSRIGGSGASQQINNQQPIFRQVLVDMREFRSSLPSCVHKLNIDLEPVTLEIGDYILTPDTCLERKSISDLIGSLNSGRLYSQAQAMTRYYKRPLLLIEFEEAKSFNFKARYWTSTPSGGSAKSSSRPSPLTQLIVLTIHFPLLRLVWSPTPNFSAEIIDQLKQGKDEPDRERDVIRLSSLSATGDGPLTTVNGAELPPEYITDRYDIDVKDFLLALPGVTTGNVYSLLNGVESLAALTELAIEELTEIIGSTRHANQLYQALHVKLIAEDESAKAKAAKQKAAKRFTYLRKKK